MNIIQTYQIDRKTRIRKGEQSDGKKICRNKQKEHDVLLLYDVDDGYSLLVMHAVAFICDGDKIVGCGRALSDGVCQAAIYNVALRPAYQGNGLGRAIVDSLVEQVKGCTIILYTHPQTLAMYEKFGFRRQKTGFVMFAGDEEQQKWLEEEGFLLPDGYRFGDNEYERRVKE